MNDINYQSITREAVQAKFKGLSVLDSKATPKYPYSAEREYARVNRAYIKVMHDVLREYLPDIMKAYVYEMRNDSRQDGITDFVGKLNDTFFKMTAEMEKRLEELNVQKAIKMVSKMVQDNAIREWTKTIKRTLGVDILEEYYRGESYRRLMEKWDNDNALGIINVPNSTMLNIRSIIESGYRQKKRIGEVKREVQKEYEISKRRSVGYARDQVGTLSSAMSEAQQREAGIKRYRWRSKRDDRVREAHREFDGKIFSWDDPPEEWYITKSRGIIYTGNHFHPGEAWMCRCVADPVFEIETLTLPLR